MSQPTHTTSGGHEASAADQTQTAATPAKRRFRRTTARNKAAAPQADQTATTTASANETHEASQPSRPSRSSQPSHAAPAADTPAATAPAAEHGTPAQPAEPQAATPAKPQQKSARASRGRRGGRKADVQLVVPPTTPASELPALTETLESAPAATEEPRVVPVVTERAALPEMTEPDEQPAALAPRRYRFERRSPQSAPTLVRPERLTGATGTIAPAQPLTPEQNPLAPPVEAEPTVDEEQPEAWQATVAEVAPEAIDQNAAARSDVAPFDLRERATRQVVSDIVEALGLREEEQLVAERRHALHLEPAQAGEADEGDLAEGDGEAEAHAEQEGETQGTSRRRRRRRRGGGAHAVSTPDEEQHEPAAAEEPPSPNGYDAYGDFGPFEQPYSPYNRPVRERPAPLAAATAQPWEIAPGPQQQTRQPESPFGSPEPSFARGFGPQPRGVAGPARESFARTQRSDRGLDTPPMSSNQLGAMVTHAIQQQTDRMLAELRHQPQPPSMTVTFPPFPSTERVGVFVDVANLLYSARGMRITLDFGKLLDFLRGNRRMIRAHAYAPTNPEPGAEQAFLSAVKGVGYRITTKNYKTFASGAKKADMDLDLCMDIVRMVDAKALDTVVLVSGDSDFLPLLEYCSDHGVRVEVAAFDDSAAMILRQSCDLFINLSVVPEIRL